MDKNTVSSESSIGVTFTSLMAAVTLFFAGILVSQYSSFSDTIRVPLILLIISTFSSIFAATIYSNANEEASINKIDKAKKHLTYCNVIFEFLGIYTLIFSIPLVVGSVTNDNFLGGTTMIIALVAFLLYAISGFSALHKEIRYRKFKYIIAPLLVLTNALLFLSQRYQSVDNMLPYNYISLFLVIFLLILTTVYSHNSSQYKSR